MTDTNAASSDSTKFQRSALGPSVRELVDAGFSGIWIESHEHPDAIAELAEMCRGEQSWRLVVWDIDRGLCSAAGSKLETESVTTDPLAAVRMHSARSESSVGSDPNHSAQLLVLQNFHRFLGSAELVQAVAHAVTEGKRERKIVLILAPLVDLPVELEKLFVVLEHPRPTAEQLEEIARSIATEEGELPGGAPLQSVLEASAGLTRYEAENAYSLSLVRHGCLAPPAIWELKTQTLHKSGLLSLHRGQEDFASLGGLESLKAFTKRALLRSRGSSQLARGVMLLSPPGCGKSQFCKCLGHEVGRPVLMLDVGSLMGSLVGQSESRTRQALQAIDAMAPAILMIDEVEKAFAGAASAGQNDGGVSSRMFGTFLSWLNDHDSDVFVVCTANDVARLPPEFSRAERFDAVFFVDLPDRGQKDAIWEIYLQRYQLDAPGKLPCDEQWTGAEIKSCCRLAALLDLPLSEAARHVVPVAVTAAESVDRLRGWAEGRCLSADQGGIYRAASRRSTKRRAVTGKPSQN